MLRLATKAFPISHDLASWIDRTAGRMRKLRPDKGPCGLREAVALVLTTNALSYAQAL